MRRIECFDIFANLFQYRTIRDEKGNEYILFANNKIDDVQNVQDRTAFEAVQNHEHLFSVSRKGEYERSFEIAKKIGQALLNNLQACYPEKKFYVFVTCRKQDDMIVRFHQAWENEPTYYDPVNLEEKNEFILMFTNKTGDDSPS